MMMEHLVRRQGVGRRGE